MLYPCGKILKRYIIDNLRILYAQIERNKMNLFEIAFIYLALKNQNEKQGKKIFIKLILNLKEKDLPFVIMKKELAFIDQQ